MTLSPERRQALTAKAETYTQHLDTVMPYLLQRGISRQVAEMFKLGCVPPGGEYAGRLSIPYLRPAGVIHLKYRCANPDHHQDNKHVHDKCPKYLYEQGTQHSLYNAHVLIRETGLVVVTEGELDAICVQAYCGIAAVGYPGTQSWAKNKNVYRLCFESVAEVIVVADGNDVGRESARRVAESIGSAARVVELPEGSDSNDYIVKHKADGYKERLFS